MCNCVVWSGSVVAWFAQGDASADESSTEWEVEEEDDGSGSRALWDYWDEEPEGVYLTTVSASPRNKCVTGH